ncbi:hypothetical protein, partial [Candidatus Hakubella thermalkaliphila]
MIARTGRTITKAIFCALFGSFALEDPITPNIKLSTVTRGTRRNREMNHDGVKTKLPTSALILKNTSSEGVFYH